MEAALTINSRRNIAKPMILVYNLSYILSYGVNGHNLASESLYQHMHMLAIIFHDRHNIIDNSASYVHH